MDGQKTWYIHDGDEVIAEYGNTGSLEAEYIAGVGLDEWLVLDNSTGRYYYAQDGLGSTRYLTDTSGNLVEQYQYDPYGNVSIFDAAGTSRFKSDVNNPYLYTGRRLDEETGLYHYRNRGYHPELGRFLQRDPLGYIDSLNLYSYVVNNPVNWVDPFGEQLAPPGPWYASPWFWVVTFGGWAAYEAGQAWNRNPPSWPDWFPRTETDTSGGRNFCPVQNQADGGSGRNSDDTDRQGRRRPHGKKKQSTGNYKGKNKSHETNVGEKADSKRPLPRKRPKGWKGKWPPGGTSTW